MSTVFYIIVVVSALLILFFTNTVQAQGIALSGVGPVNRSMGGASTAAPIDAAGAIHWNPASINGLARSEILFGIEMLLPSERLSSSIEPNVFGAGLPPVRLAGSDRSEPGVAPIPTMAIVHKPENSCWTYGLGIFGIAGFRVNYPSSVSNPILMPQNNVPGGLGGLGRVYAQAEYLQIAPTVAYAVTDKLSVGFSPTLTLGQLAADPLVFVDPDNADGDPATYPSGRGSRYHWGGGFQLGVYYYTESCWHFGFSLKSKQWFEKIRFNTEDELGAPRTDSVHFDYPMILSFGTAYSGVPCWLFACDVRYFDYKNTAGYGDPAAFDANGRVTGLGWNSIVSVHMGAQRQVNDRLSLRMGYQYNDNPITSNAVFFNVASPLIIQHIISVGMSYSLTDNLYMSLAYVHGFENVSSGNMNVPGIGPVPGTNVETAVSADALSFGFTMQY